MKGRSGEQSSAADRHSLWRLHSNRLPTQRLPDCSNDGKWPRWDFPGERRKLTLVGTAIAPKVILPPRLADGLQHWATNAFARAFTSSIQGTKLMCAP